MVDIQYKKFLLAGGAALAAGLLFGLPLHAEQRPMAGPELTSDASRALAPSAHSANRSAGSASDEAKRMVAWVNSRGDNQRMPFVIVDKKAAKVFVFDGSGKLLGDTPVLLGLARGDESAPGVGDKKLSDIPPEERTTPAGRFVASLGYGLGKQDILWVDYASALALHRVLPVSSRESRLQQAASGSPQDRRITFGCINVPSAFYDAVIHPVFSKSSGVVYILPEIKTIAEVFSGYPSFT